MTRFTRARTALVLAACLLLAQGAVVTLLGTSTPGPVLSDLIEVAVAGLAMFHCSRASGTLHRSSPLFLGFGRNHVHDCFRGFQSDGLSEFFPGSVGLQWVGNMLGCFWFFPLALGMFLDPERETRDWICWLRSTSCKPPSSASPRTSISFIFPSPAPPASWVTPLGPLISLPTRSSLAPFGLGRC